MDQGQGTQQTDPAEAKHHYAQGAKLLKARDVDGALRELAQAVKLKPLYPEALRALGLAFKAKGDRSKAQKYFNAAALACVRLGRHDDAVKLYHACQNAGLPAKNPFFVLATCIHEKGSAQKSCEYYERALELTPESPAVAAGFVRALADVGSMEQALRFLHSYLRQYPDSQDLLRLRADLPELPPDAEVRQDIAPSGGGEVLSQVLEGESDEGFDFEEEGKPLPQHPEKPPVQEIVEQPKEDCREKRRSPRMPMADYFLRFPKRKEHQPVVDICREGVGFKFGEMPLRRGQKLQFDLMALEKVKIKKLHAVVRHVTHGMAGCEFENLSKKQQKLLDKILFSEDACMERKDAPEDSCGAISFDLDMW